ncbi:hypothetical protein BVC80_1815g83 [Macleaya cordata]|uniref:Uncharacterized protein n=1 Tax=Macleaya cordata TaxID=56857 RepID=A0A200QW21_MACCD|nr:hypothetical protein BVC80_1815g83 [Macleaya cordata]
MADIAMLVAEEYERRINRSSTTNKGNHDQGGVMMDFVTGVSVLAQRFDHEFSLVKKVEKFEYAKKILDPKSPFGFAAMGFSQLN